MSRKLGLSITLLLFIFVPSCLFSQPTLHDSTEVYIKWTKRGIIKVVYAYMEDYLATVDSNEHIDEYQSSKEYHELFIKNIDSTVPDDNLDSVENYLKKNHWAGTANKIFKPLKNKLVDRTALDDKFFSIGDNRFGKKFTEKKNEVINNYNEALSSISIKPQNDTNSSYSTAVFDSAENEESVTDNKSFYLFALIYFLAGLVIGALSIFMYSKRKIYSILSMEKSKYRDKLRNSNESYLFKYIGFFVLLKERKDFYKEKLTGIESKCSSDISELNTQISELNDKNQDLLKENVQLGAIIDNYKATEVQIKTKETSSKPVNLDSASIKNTLYFTIPDSQGCFRIDNSKAEKDAECYYKIEADVNKQKGTLHFISSALDSRAIDSIDSYLNPVCDIENISNRPKAKRISTIKPGLVILVGDTWKIDNNNKLKIKLV